MVEPSILDWLQHTLSQTDVRLTPIGGGCISQAFAVTTPDSQRYFLKVNGKQSLFYAEAEGLVAINNEVPGFVPSVLAVSDNALLLEYLDAVPESEAFWQSLGRSLAQMHRQPKPYFGFTSDNYCGATPQLNPPTDDGFEFFAEHRLLYQARLAHRRGLLSSAQCQLVERLCWRLSELIPRQPAVLIHGDLWSGNVMSAHRGACIVDPACYYGWAEADLAMTTLFGGFNASFYDAYHEEANVTPDWRKRADIYNLYHWLNRR
jgi:fructosamine-3-kinase